MSSLLYKCLLFPMCVCCVVCICVVQNCVCVQTEIDIRHLPQSLSTLFIETGTLN